MFKRKKIKVKKDGSRMIVDYGNAKNSDFLGDFINELQFNEWIIMIDTNFVPNHAQHMVDDWIVALRDWLESEAVTYKQSRSIRQNTSIMGSLAKLGKRGEDYQYKMVFTLKPELLKALIERYDDIHMIHHMGIGLKKDSIAEDFTSGMIDAQNVLEYIETDLYHHKELNHLTIISKSISKEDITSIIDKIAKLD